MIERYSITVTAEQLAERFAVDVPEFYRPHYNAAPTQLLPIITSSAPNGLSLFYWGTSPEWSKNKMPAEKTINIRTEYFAEKQALRRALTKTRCLIPADGFYAWKKVGKKTSIPYRFVPVDNAAFALAGLWEEFEDTEGQEMHTFSIITAPANMTVSLVSERMPVILSRRNESAWMNPASTEAELLAIVNTEYEGPLSFYPVSPGISNTSFDLASMIIPTPPVDQHGNLTLFD
ncbi:MAG TPA: SOS response-associated peptidase [Chryseosolibacter sp.]|nr:SOS response-associated peptidase [Chryseosolibacter sp.]